MKIRKLILNTLFCCAITLLSMFVTVSAYARDNSDYIDSAAEEYVAENGITYQVINDSFSAKGEKKIILSVWTIHHLIRQQSVS